MMGVTNAPLIELRRASRNRSEASGCVRVEADQLCIGRGELVALTGEGGCGKNLLLRLLGLQVPPESGEVFFDGQPTAQLTDDARVELRNRRCGYLFAAPFLLAAFNVAENVAMPIFKISQLTPEEARARTETLLRFVGIDSSSTHRELSRAGQHRVALARALANQPDAIFLENFDAFLPDEELLEFRQLLHRAAQEFQTAVVFTASPSLTPVDGERRFEIADGRVIGEVEA